MPSFLSALVRHPQVAHHLINARSGVTVATELLNAFDSTSRRKGLLGRDSLPDGAAILIAPCNAVHTFFMRFSIDVAFLAKDGRVLKVRHSVPPRRIAVALRAYAVAELPAGTLARADVRSGDTLVVSPASQI